MMPRNEYYLLGDLMKEINKEGAANSSINESDKKSISNPEEKTIHSSLTLDEASIKLSHSPEILEDLQSINECKEKFKNKKTIMNAFKSQKMTISLQKILKTSPNNITEKIVLLLSGSFSYIMKNKNGNYFCRDLFRIIKKEQRIKILIEINNSLYEDSLDKYATHPIQVLIDMANTPEEYKLLISPFNDVNRILLASINSNASYVIKKLIIKIPEIFRSVFNELMLTLIHVLSLDMYGVFIVKLFISYTRNEIILKQIFNIILNNFINISFNQYGNYLVKYILDNWWDSTYYINNFKKMIINNFHILARNQFSYHICEEYIDLCNYNELQFLLYFLKCNNIYNILLEDKFANYSIKKLVSFITFKNPHNNVNNNKKI